MQILHRVGCWLPFVWTSSTCSANITAKHVYLATTPAQQALLAHTQSVVHGVGCITQPKQPAAEAPRVTQGALYSCKLEGCIGASHLVTRQLQLSPGRKGGESQG